MTTLNSTDPGAIVAILFRRVGDSLLATPALRALKEQYPERKIRVIAEPQTARVFEGLQFVDELVVSSRSPSPIQLMSLMRRGEGAIATLDFLSDPRSAIASRLSGASIRVGFGVGVRKLLYTHRVAKQDQRAPVYSAIHKLRLAEQLGASSAEILPEFELTSEELTRSSVMWQRAGLSNRGVVAIFVSSRRSYKRWPLTSFIQLIEEFRACHIPEIVLVGSTNEESEMREFAQSADLPPARVLACDSLGVLASVLKRATILVGNDGGPKHLACAVGTATATIFRHDPPEYWTPPNNPLHVALNSPDGTNVVKVFETVMLVYNRALM